MVRLSRRPQGPRPTTASTRKSSSAPRVKMCISWRYVLTCLFTSYAVGLVVVLLTLDGKKGTDEGAAAKRNPNYHDPLHLIMSNDVVSHWVEEAQRDVDQLENQLLKWTAWDNSAVSHFKSYDEVEVLTMPVDILRMRKMESTLQQLHPEMHIQLCRRLGDTTVLTRKTKTDSKANIPLLQSKNRPPQYTNDILASCRDLVDDSEAKPKSYYLYNPFQHGRLLCDFKIPANGFKDVSEYMRPDSSPSLVDCLEDTHLYPALPDAAISKLNPIVIRDMLGEGKGSPIPQSCDVPCHFAGLSLESTLRRIAGTPFQITFSMEGPDYYEEIQVQSHKWKQNKFFSTTSFKSDIPLPYFSFAEYDIQHGHNPVNFDKAIKGAVFLARNCFSKNEREVYVQSLIDLSTPDFRFDSLSICVNNADPPSGISLEDKTKVMRQYLFYLAFENQNAEDYITEKLWGAFVAGVVPVYMGSPNIKEHVPDHSIIVVDDFDSPDALAKYLREVASDRDLYQAYHEWRKEPLPDHFMRKYNFTKTHNLCRTCRWANAKKYGLGWSHERQMLVDLRIPRHACRDEDGMLTWPVRERWYRRQDNDDATPPASNTKPTQCTRTAKLPWEDHATVADQWERAIHEHDGVIDLRLRQKERHVETDDESTKHPVVLEMALPFDDSDKALRFRQLGPGHLQWQNETSRMTLLVKPGHRIPIRRPTASTIQLMHPQAIRIIAEDVDLFHEGAANAVNYFGGVMTQDWETSLEVFVSE